MTPAEYAGIVVRELLAAGAARVRVSLNKHELAVSVYDARGVSLGGGMLGLGAIDCIAYPDGRAILHAAEIAGKCGLPGVPK